MAFNFFGKHSNIFFHRIVFFSASEKSGLSFLFLLPQRCIFAQHCCVIYPVIRDSLVLHTSIELLSAALVYNFNKKIIMPLSTTF